MTAGAAGASISARTAATIAVAYGSARAKIPINANQKRCRRVPSPPRPIVTPPAAWEPADAPANPNLRTGLRSVPSNGST
jgi:hypothetical protein